MAQPPLDFPSSPSIGQIYNAPNGVAYIWDGTKWDVIGGPGGGGVLVSIGPTPPTNPVSGQLWWRSDPDGNLYVWYNDGSSSQWVPAMASVGRGAVAAPIGPAGGDLNGSFPSPALNSVLSISSLGLAARGSFYSGPGGASVGVNVSNHDATFTATSSSWQMNLYNGLGTDELSFQRRQPNAAANAYTSLLTVRTDGTIRVTTDPVAALDLATKQYVDAHGGGGGGSGFWAAGTGPTAGFITPAPTASVLIDPTQAIVFGANPLTGPPRIYASGVIAGELVLQCADNMAISFNAGGAEVGRVNGDGSFTATAGPVNPLDLATKQYVDSVAGSGGGGLWVDDVGPSMLVPVGANYGVALPATGDGLVLRHSTYPAVDRRTGIDADDNLLQVSGGASGILFRSVDATMPFGLVSGSGLWRLAGDGVAATAERLEVAGGIKLGGALAAQDGTLQYTGSQFQAHVGGAWVTFAPVPSGPMRLITASTTLLPTDDTVTVQPGPTTDVDITLPLASSMLGKVYTIIRLDSGAGGGVNVVVTGADLIYTQGSMSGTNMGATFLAGTYTVRAVAANRWQGGNWGN